MERYNDFCVAKCGNKDQFFLFDSAFAENVGGNTWTMDGHGYVCRNKNGKLERLHSVVFELATGKPVPKGMYIDHINKCKTDNRLCNLRVVAPKDNLKNLPLKSNNTTGYTGVSYAYKEGRYRAYITVNKKRIELGTYATAEEAARARYAAEEKFGFTHRQNLGAFLCEMEDL